MDWTWYLFRFEGRINRAKWWLALSILVFWLIFVVFMSVTASEIMDEAEPHVDIGLYYTFMLMTRAAHHSLLPSDVISLVANLLGMPVLLWTMLAISIKRLHDRGWSGWWIVPLFVLPNFFDDLVHWLPHSYLRPLLQVVLLILWIWGLVEMGFLQGADGDNRFGPDPLAQASAVDSRPPWDQTSELEFVPHIGSPPPAMHVKRGHD